MRKSLLLMMGLMVLCAAGEAGVTEVGRVREKKLNEPSGIVPCSKQPGIFWTHNDGDDGVLYAIKSDGTLVGKVSVAAKFRDWEDIASDGAGNLYLADVGNNERNRKVVSIYKVTEPDPASGGEIRAAAEWRLSFPKNKPFNCESLIVRDGFGYLISKVEKGDNAAIYRFALSPPAKKKRIEVEHVADLPIDIPATAADWSSDGKFLAVLTERALNVLQIDGDVKNAATTQPTTFRIPPVPAEGCCFASDGILMIAETGEILRAPLPAASSSSDKKPDPTPARE